jgi:thiamine-monophosphate kinase
MSRREPSLATLGEFGFIDRLRRRSRGGRGVELGPGDDCAVVRLGAARLLLTADELVENVHFRRGWESPRRLGERAFAVNASDIAAMGGRPLWALLSIAAPPSALARELAALSSGFAAAARSAGASLVGGNLSRAERWSISVALVGEAPAHPLRRDGARVGDLVCVSGTLGGAALARRRRLRSRVRANAALPLPVARVALGARLAKRGLAHAAIDVSDGLLQDLGHLCRASRVGAEIEAGALPLPPSLRRLPRPDALHLALHGGEDYEILFTVAPANRKTIERLGAAVIGRIVSRRGVRVVGDDRRPLPIAGRGWDHFGGRG